MRQLGVLFTEMEALEGRKPMDGSSEAKQQSDVVMLLPHQDTKEC